MKRCPKCGYEGGPPEDQWDAAARWRFGSEPWRDGSLRVVGINGRSVHVVLPEGQRYTLHRWYPGVGDAWRVIVRNDDHNTFEGVAFALATVVPGVTYDGGLRLASTIHRKGQAIVWSGHREPAELYWEQLAGHGLTLAPLEGA